MSDLFPLVAGVLKDKTCSDLKEENDRLRHQIEELRRQNDLLTSIEVVHAFNEDGSDVPINQEIVYAKGHINRNAEISDGLMMCQISLFGGIDQYTLWEAENTRFILRRDGGNEVGVLFSWIDPQSDAYIQLACNVHGWTADEDDPVRDIDYLVDSVAIRFPEATVEFLSVAIDDDKIDRLLERLYPQNT
eukprot:CCRYP_014863-RA/>CCRYP_014863-RA protein AED:0.39 eAED:0.39 QI:0/0.5/0.66/0.66/0.5/0.33/3/122/189